MADASILRESIATVSKLIRTGEVSPVELTNQSLAAIQASQPTLNAFRTTMPERALAQARAVEDDIRAGNYRGPLHGIPLAVKDLMDVAGETSPAGSKVLANRVASEDSEVVRLLGAAGAVLTGKTSMPEFAYSPASNNQHYGPVPNPWNHQHDSAGSSSGSGAAVAANLVYGATGSDTGGSIRMPASVCGIVGFKPTFGRVSGRGAVTLSWSLDHIGPMARTVMDTALMLEAMAGYDAGDPRTRRVAPDVYSAAVEGGVQGLRVAVLTDDGGGPLGTPGVMTGMRAGVAALSAAGASVSEVAIPELSDLTALYGVLLTLEAVTYYETYLRERPGDLGEFARDRLLTAYAYSPTTFVKGQRARAVLRKRVNDRLQGFDVLALPGMPHEAPLLGVVGSNTRFTGPFNALGWPAIVVPTGFGANNLPVALQLVARPWLETTLLAAARVVERDGPWGTRPA
jgi:aspartyl-tRNA(Asn)/glutamyl-tRNA(Gln) amidotransferase subunit A